MQKLKMLYLEGTRIFLGLIFFSAGMSKLMPFPGIIGPSWLEERLEPFGLGLFAVFIALSQILVGILLLTKRFATLGTVMLFPLLLCILIVTISLQWTGTPYINAFLLMLNISLLAADYHKLKFIFFDDTATLKNIKLQRSNARHDYIWVLAVMIFFTGLLARNYTPAHKILLWAAGLTLISLGFLSAIYKLKSHKKV